MFAFKISIALEVIKGASLKRKTAFIDQHTLLPTTNGNDMKIQVSLRTKQL